MQLKKILLVNVFVLLFVFVSIAQSKFSFSRDRKKYDTTYVESYRDSLSVYIRTLNKNNELSIETNKGEIRFKPNSNTKFGIGFNYKRIGLAFSLFDIGKKDEDIYGKTKQVDILLNIYGRKIVFDIFLQTYKGYHVANPKILDKDWTSDDSYPYIPSMQTISIGSGLNYIWNNKKFSYRAAFNQTERQKKSAGSLILGTIFSLNYFRADTSIIPSVIKNNIAPENRYKASGIINFGLSVGYTYTYVFREQYFVTLSIVPGIALQFKSVQTDNSKYNNFKLAFAGISQIRAAIGSNNSLYFGGISIVGYQFSLNSDKRADINFKQGRVKLSFGRRF